MKKSPKKLSLNRETLRALEARQVAGGGPVSLNCASERPSCWATCFHGFCYTATCPDGCVGEVTNPVTLPATI